MITLNIDKTLIQVKGLEELRERPGFVVNLNPSEHKLKSIIGRYVFADMVQCGLSNCHSPHNRGYVVVTESGAETNIGNVCGKRYFGVEFETQSRKFDRDLEEFELRESLASLHFRLEDVEAQIQTLRNAHHGADWVRRRVRELTTNGQGYPQAVVEEINRMVRTRNAAITRERQLTEEEAEAKAVAQERPDARNNTSADADQAPRRRSPQFVREIIGELSGIACLYPENELRSLLITQLLEPLNQFSELRIEDMSLTELRRWSRWSGELERILDLAVQTVAAGQKLFTEENLLHLTPLMRRPIEIQEFRKTAKNIKSAP